MLKYSCGLYTSSMPRTFQSRIGATYLVLAAGATTLRPAQATVRTFFLMAGKDTISVEWISRSPGRTEGEMLFRSANQRWHYVAMMGPDQRVQSMDNEFRYATDLGSAPARQTAHVDFAGDSVFVTVAGRSPTQRLSTRAGAFPYVNPSFGMVELAIRRAVMLKQDSLDIPLFVLSGGVTIMASVVRAAPDSVVFVVGGVPSRLAVTPDGAIRGGVIPAQALRLDVIEGVPAGAFVVAKPDYSAPDGAPYTALAVKVPTPMGHTLAGTLTLPSGARGPVPAVVTITGSGPEDRDEAIPPVKGYRPFREIADALGRRGIAVLRMDDRGFGESEGNFGAATSRDLADDIRAGLAFLRARSDIDGRRLALVGHSEGGLIAPLVAASDSGLKGIVLLAGPGYTGRKIVEYQNRFGIDRAPNLSPKARDSLYALAMHSLDSAATTPTWMGFFLTHDPTVTARQVHTPVLILQGETDRQVTADQAAVLAEAFRAGGNKDVTMRVYPATNHLFLPDPDGNPAGYSGLQITMVRPEVLRDLADWLSRRLPLTPPRRPLPAPRAFRSARR
jgi:dienelactone hydrolase